VTELEPVAVNSTAGPAEAPAAGSELVGFDPGRLAGVSAIWVRELRGRMRGKRAFIFLTFYLGLLTTLLWLALRTTETLPGLSAIESTMIGRGIFGGVLLIETLVVVGLAPAYTAGAISSEREKQTYDLLAVTPISSVAIVLGKLFSGLSYLALIVFASLPIACLAFVFGGIGPEDLVRGSVVLILTGLGVVLGDVVDCRARHEASDRGVRTSVIVEVDEVAERLQSIAVGAIRPGVGPLVEQGLDEPLGLAVGLGPERPGPLVADLEPPEDVAIGVAAIARAVVGQHPLDPDPDLGELGDRQLDRPRGALAALVDDRYDDGVAAGVVDEDLEMVVADAAILGPRQTLSTTSPPAAASRHPAELLVVLVDEGARMAGHVADRSGGHPVGIAQAVQAGPPEDAVDRRAGMAGQRGQAGRAVPPTSAGRDDRGGHLVGRAAWRAMRSRAAVLESGQPVRPESTDPLVRRRPADPELLGDRRGRPTIDHHPLHQELPTEDAEPSTRMCHESLRPMWVLNTSHRVAGLSFVNNGFGHHT
jgi:hypothetical protein